MQLEKAKAQRDVGKKAKRCQVLGEVIWADGKGRWLMETLLLLVSSPRRARSRRSQTLASPACFCVALWFSGCLLFEGKAVPSVWLTCEFSSAATYFCSLLCSSPLDNSQSVCTIIALFAMAPNADASL